MFKLFLQITLELFKNNLTNLDNSNSEKIDSYKVNSEVNKYAKKYSKGSMNNYK